MELKIAFIHAGFPGGGAERITKDIAEYLSRFDGRYKVYVFTRNIHNRLLTPEHTRDITLVQMSGNSVEEFSDLIENYGIDILVQSSYPIKGIREIRHQTGVKVVFACHEEPFWRRYITKQRGFFKNILFKVLPESTRQSFAYKEAVKWTRAAYDNCDAFTVLCDRYKEIVKNGLSLSSVNHIHAIENPEYKVDNVNYSKENIIFFCGRLDQMSKQIDRLLRIWKSVQARLPEWKLLIAGDGPDRGFLMNLAESLHLERCEFIGHQTDVSSIYAKASVVCLTSRTEGWPLCLTEAQANGCIPVAFGCTAGVEDILAPEQNGPCGFVIEPYDEGAYAETLVRIASLPSSELETIRKNAVGKRLKYVPEVIAEKWRLLLESLHS